MTTYVPILPADRSQLAGLAATADSVKDRLMPLFDVPPVMGTGGPSAGPDRQLTAVIDAVRAAFGGRRAYLDGEFVAAQRVADGRLVSAWLFDEARTRGLALVPVTGLRRSAPYQLAVAEAASVDGRGLCLRLQFPDFVELDALSERVHALVDALGVGPEVVDVLVDLGCVAAGESRVLLVAARAVLGLLRRAGAWRSVALAATGVELAGASGGGRRTADLGEPIPSTEWLLWRTLAADAPALGFADYAGAARDEATVERMAARSATPGGHADRTDRSDAAAPAWPLGRGTGAQPAADAPPLPGHSEYDAAPAPAVGPWRADVRPDAEPAAEVRPPDGRAAALARHLTVVVEGIARAERAAR